MQPLTTIIIARNAEDTIERAVQSVMDGGRDWPILLVDDFSDDQTVKRAQELAGEQVRVVRPDQHIGTGNARQTGLDHVETDFAVWLDADDRAHPERMSLCLNALRATKADMVIHSASLKDGKADNKIGKLSIPNFLMTPAGFSWQLERNYSPILCPAFKVNAARKVGFDRSLIACEDYDHFVSMLLMNAKISFLKYDCLDVYAYAGSVSRNLDRHQAQLQKIYQRHSPKQITGYLKQQSCIDGGISEAVHAFILASRAVYAQDYDQAALYADKMDPEDMSVAVPYGRPFAVLKLYILGVCALKRQDFLSAKRWFETCLVKEGFQADVMNNLGVSYAALGEISEAERAFVNALEIKPEYLDAQMNLKNVQADQQKDWRITSHPLRFFKTRSVY